MKVDNSFPRYGHSKFSKMAGGRILDLVQSEVGPIDPPSPKPYPRIKQAAILDLVQPEIAPFDPPTSKTLP